jgi:hypothetical protein
MNPGLKQVSLLAMATHKQPKAEEISLGLLNSSEKTIRYAAATVLVNYKRAEAKPVLEEIMNLRYDVALAGELNGAQVEGLKINVLTILENSNWKELQSWVAQIAENDTNVKVATKAKQVANMLKN